MARGNGLIHTNKYKWTRQPNGKYTIFSVPFFGIYKRESLVETKDGVQKNISELNQKEAMKVLENFKKRKELGYYPRIHEEHHDSASSKKLIGYLDNVGFDGKVFYADFAEIKEEDLGRIKNLELPGRSAEYDDEKKEIESLALLQTQSPYFKFSDLALEDEPIEMSGQEAILFSLNSNRIQKFVEGSTMDPEEEKDKENFSDVENTEVEEEEDDTPTWARQLMSDNAEIKQRLSAIEGGGAAGPGQVINDKEPMPVAMQQHVLPPQSFAGNSQFSQLQIMQKQIDSLQSMQKSIASEREIDHFSQRLRKVCDEAGYDYNDEIQLLQQFSDSRSKRTYIESLEVKAQRYPTHEQTTFARQFRHEKAASKTLQKFANESPQIQSLARRMQKDYFDTLGQQNETKAKRFRKAWPTEEGFIQYFIEAEKSNPGNYDNFSKRGA